MTEASLEKKVEAALERLHEFGRRAAEAPEAGSGLLGEAIQELSTTLEELGVASEELKQQADELAESNRALAGEQRRYQDLFDFAPDGYLVTDAGGVIQEANRAAAELLGVRQDYLRRKPLLVFVNKADLSAFQSKVAELPQKRGAEQWGMRLKRRGRESFPASVAVVAVRDKTGEVSGLRWQVRDITERKAAEGELRAAELRYRTLAESLPQLVWTCRADGPCDYLSPQWITYTGIPEAQQLGYGWSKQLHPDDWPRVQAAWAESVKTGGPFDIEFRIRRADGEYRWFATRAVPLRNEDGEIVQWLGLNLDIEDMKRAGHGMHAALAELERSNRELEQFAYVASHDLQEPLRMVSSYVQLLARDYGDRLDADAAEYIGFAVEGANRMQRMILDLLVLSRVGTRGRSLEPIESRDALVHALENLRVAIKESGAKVSRGRLPKVVADETQLTQLFQNLIENAIKFRGGEPPRVRVSAKKDGGDWVFSVADNGIGIDAKYFDRIFAVFQRLHAKEEHQGTGIGLAICLKIVQRHSGRIWVESKPGQGSTFHFALPIERRSTTSRRRREADAGWTPVKR